MTLSDCLYPDSSPPLHTQKSQRDPIQLADYLGEYAKEVDYICCSKIDVIFVFYVEILRRGFEVETLLVAGYY